MAYNTFTINQVRRDFGIQLVEDALFIPEFQPVEPSEMLRSILDKFAPLAEAIGTEKAKSEFVIAPILAEVREIMEHQVSLFSGIEFNVEPKNGLNGRCDFIISASNIQYTLTAPVLALVEAKQGNINPGLGQCMAEMVAAQIHNQKEGNDIEFIYGCVTNSDIWRFLRLQGKTMMIEKRRFALDPIERLLGVLVQLVS
ncbi:MAG: hypothetical protein AAF702_04445 [Chloroflexota bacterium]